MQRVNLHLAFCSICDCKTCCLAAESLSQKRVRVYKQFARIKDVQRGEHYSGFGAGFLETRRQCLELQFTERIMANPANHVVLGEEEAQQAAERYATMEAELQVLRQRNEELMRTVQEQQDLVAAERVQVDSRSRAQTQEFANLTMELLAGRQGPDVQFDGMRIGVKVENLRRTAERRLATWIRGCSKFANIWIS